MSNQLNPTRQQITTLIAGLVLITATILAICYFSVWRPTDSDYTAATTQLNTIRADVTEAGGILGGITKSTDIDDSVVSEIDKVTVRLQKTLDMLTANKAARQESDYAGVRDATAKYKDSLHDVSVSLQKYLTLIDQCTILVQKINTISTTAAFKQLSQDCSNAISSAKQAPSKNFRDQYLSTYTKNAESLLQGYGNLVDSKNSFASRVNIEQVRRQIISDRDIVLDLKIAPDDVDTTITRLGDSLNQRKASFLR